MIVGHKGYEYYKNLVGKHYNVIVMDEVGNPRVPYTEKEFMMYSDCTPEQLGSSLCSVNHETLADLEKSQQGEKMNETSPWQISSSFGLGTQLTNTHTININNIQTPNPMTRLTTSGDWTILLENDKLVAVDSTGKTIRAVGSLLSADGKAWMWHGGKLWSGALELTDTEAGVREKERVNKIRERQLKEQKILLKRDEKVGKIHEAADKELSKL